MAGSDIWTVIHREREALAKDLDGIDAAQWNTTSLCTEWSVGQVFAHMTSAAMMTPPQFIAKFAAARFRFNDYANKEVAKYYRPDPDEAIAVFRSAAHRTTSPPGPKPTWVGETVVHAEDIRRPLGISHEYDMAALRQAADFYQGSNVLIGARERIVGLRLEATDTDWSHGEGPTARGPMLSIVMAMTGRKAYIDELTGGGTALLRERP
jgi:uncharacterized protein (TIGR03083 family)